MKTELKQEIETTFGQLYQAISLFTQNEINLIPFEGSWTAGQVTRHIIKATTGFHQICDGNTKKLHAAFDEKVPIIKKIFLDFNSKYNSPEFIYPETKDYDKTELLSTLQKIENEMLDIAENYDLTLTCMDFEIPGIGNLTIYELLTFGISHSKRHTHQLQNIYKVINK
ncbi:DinB family protein [Flavobacterium pectinovorum]|uniref:DinB family protein n=1 Tax=Flavobacterium pectinovorum TaxID=29533 RepID=A0A502EL59_9FLAO|nr:DinB family protein [Flavobacterium pectinovorum]TPG38448.1 DinB family protein [Flavobacterium pectinovorum]